VADLTAANERLEKEKNELRLLVESHRADIARLTQNLRNSEQQRADAERGGQQSIDALTAQLAQLRRELEAARVTHGPIILVQSLHAGSLGYTWLRVREFLWTIVAFHISKMIGYVPVNAKFTMRTRRFYTAAALQRDLVAAGLRIRTRRDWPILPGRALVVAGLMLERDD
jgi:hypothetical protein